MCHFTKISTNVKMKTLGDEMLIESNPINKLIAL